MSINSKLDGKQVVEKLKQLYSWIMSLDYKNPRIVLTAIAIIILPFMARQIVLTAILLGILMAISILWLIERMPNSIRKLIVNNPLAADLILTVFAVAGMSTLFGPGLTLALAAVICDFILSCVTHHIKVDDETVQQEATRTSEGEFGPAHA